MLRLSAFLWFFLIAGSNLPLQAQGVESEADAARPRTTSHLLRENYLTATGATVAHPGQPQGAPTSPLDRRIMRENNILDRSICSNCE